MKSKKKMAKHIGHVAARTLIECGISMKDHKTGKDCTYEQCTEDALYLIKTDEYTPAEIVEKIINFYSHYTNGRAVTLGL